MSEFDRTKHTVGNRTILVTSWFDDALQTWRASAPRYTYLEGILTANQVHYEKRQQAINAVITILSQHFSG
jgi:hypothetical protein